MLDSLYLGMNLRTALAMDQAGSYEFIGTAAVPTGFRVKVHALVLTMVVAGQLGLRNTTDSLLISPKWSSDVIVVPFSEAGWFETANGQGLKSTSYLGGTFSIWLQFALHPVV